MITPAKPWTSPIIKATEDIKISHQQSVNIDIIDNQNPRYIHYKLLIKILTPPS